MLLKIVYLLTCRVLGLAVVVFRGDRAKDGELLVLRHENAVLRRHASRVRYEPADRVWLAALVSRSDLFVEAAHTVVPPLRAEFKVIDEQEPEMQPGEFFRLVGGGLISTILRLLGSVPGIVHELGADGRACRPCPSPSGHGIALRGPGVSGGHRVPGGPWPARRPRSDGMRVRPRWGSVPRSI